MVSYIYESKRTGTRDISTTDFSITVVDMSLAILIGGCPLKPYSKILDLSSESVSFDEPTEFVNRFLGRQFARALYILRTSRQELHGQWQLVEHHCNL